MRDFLYRFCDSWEWNLILQSNFVCAGQNYYEPLIDKGHVATANGEVEIIMQHPTDRYQ